LNVKKEGFIPLACAFAASALSFWLPIVIARLAFGEYLGVLLTILPLTLVLPVLLCSALDFMGQRSAAPRPRLALAMMAGIWATGPFFMMLALTLKPGEGFHQPGDGVQNYPITKLRNYQIPLSVHPESAKYIPAAMASWDSLAAGLRSS
jgi:hypothetical protein